MIGELSWWIDGVALSAAYPPIWLIAVFGALWPRRRAMAVVAMAVAWAALYPAAANLSNGAAMVSPGFAACNLIAALLLGYLGLSVRMLLERLAPARGAAAQPEPSGRMATCRSLGEGPVAEPQDALQLGPIFARDDVESRRQLDAVGEWLHQPPPGEVELGQAAPGKSDPESLDRGVEQQRGVVEHHPVGLGGRRGPDPPEPDLPRPQEVGQTRGGGDILVPLQGVAGQQIGAAHQDQPVGHQQG